MIRPHGSQVLGASPNRLDLYTPLGVARAMTPQARLLDLQRLQAMSGIFGIYTLDEFATDGQRLAYEDSAGVTPASVGGVCGLLMDQSLGLVLGPELVPSPLDLTSGAWQTLGTLNATTQNSFTNASGVGAGKTLTNVLTLGKIYQISVTFTKTDATTSFRVEAGTNTAASAMETTAASGTLFGTLTAALNTYVYLRLAGNTTVTITSISVREVHRNHAIQATTANKSTLRVTPTSGVRWLDAATATAAMTVTLPSAISNATVFNATPTGVVKTTGVNLGSSYSLTSPYTWFSGRVVIDAAVHGATTAAEDALITRWLTNYVPQLGANLVSGDAAHFDNGVGVWASSSSFAASASATSGEMIVTSVDAYGRMVLAVAGTYKGNAYALSGQAKHISGSGGAFIALSAETNGASASITAHNSANSFAQQSSVLVATSAISPAIFATCGCNNSSSTGMVNGFDNVVVQQIL